MRRDVLERITASIVIIFITLLALGLILVIGNGVFGWDIFPKGIETVIYFIGACLFVITLCSAIINVMLNISRMAFFMKTLVEHQLSKDVSHGKRK